MPIETMRNRNNKPAQEAPENHPRRGRARPVGEDALGQAASVLGRSGFADPALVLRWADIAGPEVARVAAPLRMQEGPDGATLILASEPAAAVFLQHETRALIDRLNGFFGRKRISRLRFLPAKIEAAAEPPAHPAAGRGQTVKAEPAEDLAGALQNLDNLRSRGTAKPGRPD